MADQDGRLGNQQPPPQSSAETQTIHFGKGHGFLWGCPGEEGNILTPGVPKGAGRGPQVSPSWAVLSQAPSLSLHPPPQGRQEIAHRPRGGGLQPRGRGSGSKGFQPTLLPTLGLGRPWTFICCGLRDQVLPEQTDCQTLTHPHPAPIPKPLLLPVVQSELQLCAKD